MQIAVLAHGTRGDSYPLMALAAELARRGHTIRMGMSPNMLDAPRRLGLDAAPLGWDTQRTLASERGREWVDTTDTDTFLGLLYEIAAEHGERVDGEVIDLCDGCDAVVSGVTMEWRGTALAEARGIPHIVHDFYPHRENDVVPEPLVTTEAQPSAAATRATYRRLARMNWRHLRPHLLRFRERLGLTPVPRLSRSPRRPALELQAYSPTLVPGLTWGEHQPFVGDLRLTPADLQRFGASTLDPELAAWLDAGDPPVLVTFGSTQAKDPAGMLAGIGRVCSSLGLRGLVVTGWGLSDAALAAAPGLKVVSYVDYDVVLPRCAMVVHHGSATITMAGVRAGLPTMVCSSSFDQPFWGSQLQRLGAGVHVRFTDLTEDALRTGLRRLMAGPVRERAAQLGERVRAEPHGTLVAADEADKFLAA